MLAASTGHTTWKVNCDMFMPAVVFFHGLATSHKGFGLRCCIKCGRGRTLMNQTTSSVVWATLGDSGSPSTQTETPREHELMQQSCVSLLGNLCDETETPLQTHRTPRAQFHMQLTKPEGSPTLDRRVTFCIFFSPTPLLTTQVRLMCSTSLHTIRAEMSTKGSAKTTLIRFTSKRRTRVPANRK